MRFLKTADFLVYIYIKSGYVRMLAWYGLLLRVVAPFWRCATVRQRVCNAFIYIYIKFGSAHTLAW